MLFLFSFQCLKNGAVPSQNQIKLFLRHIQSNKQNERLTKDRYSDCVHDNLMTEELPIP